METAIKNSKKVLPNERIDCIIGDIAEKEVLIEICKRLYLAWVLILCDIYSKEIAIRLSKNISKNICVVREPLNTPTTLRYVALQLQVLPYYSCKLRNFILVHDTSWTENILQNFDTSIMKFSDQLGYCEWLVELSWIHLHFHLKASRIDQWGNWPAESPADEIVHGIVVTLLAASTEIFHPVYSVHPTTDLRLGREFESIVIFM